MNEFDFHAVRAANRGSKYKPHQGKREIARRIEKADFLFFRDIQTGRNPYARDSQPVNNPYGRKERGK